MIATLKKLFTTEEFDPKTATIKAWEKLGDKIERTGRELDYTNKYWGHNIIPSNDLHGGMIKKVSIFSSVGMRVGDIILDNYTQGTAKLLVLHVTPTGNVRDMYFIYMAVIGYKEGELD